MNAPWMMTSGHVLAELRGAVGVLTLNRPSALNALSLDMVRDLTAALLQWRDDARVNLVLIQGAGREGKAPAFCAGGDIRFFHQAALAGDPRLDDFFTEEYTLNHLIHRFPKPTVALMDGITMGGGMGLAQGAALRVVTEHSQLAMPETQIGLFPDVGGGWFLARRPGHLGEYLALTGEVVRAHDALEVGWADAFLPSAMLPELLKVCAAAPSLSLEQVRDALRQLAPRASGPQAPAASLLARRVWIDRHFSLPNVPAIVASLAAAEGAGDALAGPVLQTLRQRSPLMLAVTLEQVRRARTMSLADELRMERDLVRHCFQRRPGAASETVEGIRALAVDKDHQPRWQPAQIEAVAPAEVDAFFVSPWPAFAHPLRALRDLT